MQNFSDLVATKSEGIEQIFISDLHLSFEPVANELVQAFLALLDICIDLPNFQRLYILGDWFEAWLGDDVVDTPSMQACLAPMLSRLQALSKKNVQILVMVGNRDFLLGQKFCDKFGGQLIKEPYFFDLADKKIRLEHGDALCTDDKHYQRFRTIIQHTLSKKLLLALPIQQREKIAHRLRQKSRQDTAIKAQKSIQIMDVNATAVENVLKNSDILLHGHTHRPAVHSVQDKQRLVLGDWRVSATQDRQVTAVIGVIINQQIQLVNFAFVPTDGKNTRSNNY